MPWSGSVPRRMASLSSSRSSTCTSSAMVLPTICVGIGSQASGRMPGWPGRCAGCPSRPAGFAERALLEDAAEPLFALLQRAGALSRQPLAAPQVAAHQREDRRRSARRWRSYRARPWRTRRYCANRSRQGVRRAVSARSPAVVDRGHDRIGSATSAATSGGTERSAGTQARSARAMPPTRHCPGRSASSAVPPDRREPVLGDQAGSRANAAGSSSCALR